MSIKTPQSETQKIPKLRFPGFSGGWEEKKLGEVCDVKGGKRIPLGYSLQTTNNGLPYITVSDMENGGVSLEKIKYVPESIAKQIKNYTISMNDIFVSVAGTLGIVGVVPKELDGANLTENADKLTDLKCDQNFLLNILNGGSLKKLIESTKTSNAQPKLAIYALKTLKLSIPTAPEQQKIAEFSGSVDEWIENLRAQKESFESYKKGMMQKIFSQEIRFKDDKGKSFPKWEEKKLGEVFISEKGDGLPKDQVIVGGKNECILYGELYTAYKEVIFDVSSKTNSNNGLKSEVGDLLIPCSTTTTGIDLANVTALNKGGVLLGGDITILRSKTKTNNIFYAYYLSNYKKREIAKYAQGSTIVHLYYNHFKKMNIDVPFYEEQQKIADFLTSIDKVIELKQQQITQAEQWKKGLMQGLFV